MNGLGHPRAPGRSARQEAGKKSKPQQRAAAQRVLYRRQQLPHLCPPRVHRACSSGRLYVLAADLVRERPALAPFFFDCCDFLFLAPREA